MARITTDCPSALAGGGMEKESTASQRTTESGPHPLTASEKPSVFLKKASFIAREGSLTSYREPIQPP